MIFLITALNMFLVGNFLVEAGRESHNLTLGNKGLLPYFSVFGATNPLIVAA